ncbi:MAG: hypothetical protein ACLGHN_08110 [Bacteriovoracia bacterium]
MSKEEKTFVKSLSDLYQKISYLQRISVGLVVSNLTLLVILTYLLQSNPIVILEKDEEKLSFQGEKREIVVTDKEIKKAVEKFIKYRYEWETFSLPEMMGNLSPIITSGLKDKILSEVKSQKDSYSAISQYVGKIKMTVDESGNVIGVFDRIIRITGKVKDNVKLPSLPEKIPLLSEGQVMVKVVKGAITAENPLGIYINSIINYETN